MKCFLHREGRRNVSYTERGERRGRRRNQQSDQNNLQISHNDLFQKQCSSHRHTSIDVHSSNIYLSTTKTKPNPKFRKPKRKQKDSKRNEKQTQELKSGKRNNKESRLE
jgi:hypothetical protein